MTQPQLEQLLRLIQDYPDGISVQDLLTHLQSGLAKRSLQYQLAKLVQSGMVERKGRGRSTVYSIPKETKISTGPSTLSIIPFSTEAIEQKELICRPIALRQHVSYRREFIDSYEPNQSFYLTSPILDKLAKLGGGLERGRPAGTYARKIYQRLLIDLSWNSSRLEGNTYSLCKRQG